MKTPGTARAPIMARPYQLLCILCRLGAGDPVGRLKDRRLNAIFQAIRRNPHAPLSLVRYGGRRHSGKDADSPRGVLFHMYQDEAILGLFGRHLDKAPSGLGRLMHAAGLNTDALCRFDPGAAPAWRGCPLSGKGYQPRGCDRLKRLLPDLLPAGSAIRLFETKNQAALDTRKRESAAAVLQAKGLRIFPSHLAYMVVMAFQYECRRAVPVPHDNLWEVAEAIRRNPAIPVMLVPDHCMVCPPCGGYDEVSGLCRVSPPNLKLAEKLRTMGAAVQLSVLRSLGLEYYQALPAHELLRRAKAGLTADHIQFNYQGAPPSYAGFERTLNDGLGFLDAFRDPRAVARRTRRLLADRRVRALLPAGERAHVEQTLAEAERHLAGGRRREAYLALTETAFAHTRKQYMELIPAGYARLPRSVPRESALAAGARVLTARARGRPAPYAAGFVTMFGVNRPAIAETGVRVRYARDTLHIGLACADAAVRRIRADARLGVDLQGIGRRYDRRIDDAVVVVLQPRPPDGALFLFTVNPKGVKLGERCLPGGGRDTRAWVRESAWQAEARVAAGWWRAEMTVPFSLLETRPKPGAAWALNAYRFFRNDMLDPHTWAPTTAWKLSDPQQCGRLAWA